MFAKKNITFDMGSFIAYVKPGVQLISHPDGDGQIIGTSLWVDRNGNLFKDAHTGFSVGSLLSNDAGVADMFIDMEKRAGTESIVETMPEALKEFDALYVERCGTCHRVYEPFMYEYDYWIKVMGSMKMQAGISDEEYDDILYYLHLSSYDAVK